MKKSPVLQMFLYDEEREREIPAADPLVVSIEQALDEFDRLSDTADNYIGFVRGDGEVLQFAWNDEGTLDIDIPVPFRDGSFNLRGPFEECRALIEPFAQGLPRKQIVGLRFDRWISD